MAATVHLDGTNVSGVAIKGSVTRRLNRPSQAQITIPMDSAIGGAGSRLKISIPGMPTPSFHGFVLDCETDTGEDMGYTVYNATDPMELWQWRPARDPDGDFSNPDFIFDNDTGPQIMEAILAASDNGALIPILSEGPLFLTPGTFAGGGVSLAGAPTDWPMTIMEVASLLVSSGELDIVIIPTDPGGGVMGTVNCHNGNFGTDRTSTVSFQYATGTLNVRRLRWNEDMTKVTNKLQYFGGPRILTAADPEGNQHWCWNITGDDVGLANPPGGDITPSTGALGALRIASQAAYGVRMEIQIWDALSDLCIGNPGKYPGGDPGRDLYRRLWQAESWLRASPRELMHITPTRGTAIGAFDIGDLVSVSAGASVRGGFSGAQRVYEYTTSWEEDGPFELSELQTSSDVGVGN